MFMNSKYIIEAESEEINITGNEPVFIIRKKIPNKTLRVSFNAETSPIIEWKPFKRT